MAGAGPSFAPPRHGPGPEIVVWEAHITDLIRRDNRWHQLWATFLRSCIVPENAEKFPGHSSKSNSRQGKLFQEEYKHCLDEPKFQDKMTEYASKASKVFKIRGKRGQWQLGRGKFTRTGTDEEEQVREALSMMLGGAVMQRGNTYMPPNGYELWHTNAFDKVGWRLYIIHNVPAGKSGFRYRHPTTGLTQTCSDTDGTLRLFRASSSPPFWHSVTSEGHRWSMGFRLNPDAAHCLQAWMRPVVPLTVQPTRPAAIQTTSSSSTPPPTPRAVTLLFGSRARLKQAKRRAEAESQKEETKAGDVVAWVTSGEGDEEDDSLAEIESLDEVRLSEPSPLAA